MTVRSKYVVATRRTAMSQRHLPINPSPNIYHGMLPPDAIQIAQPVQYASTGGTRIPHVEGSPYLSRRDTFPNPNNPHRHLLPIHSDPSNYGHQGYGMSQGINTGGSPMHANPYQTQYSSELDPRYMPNPIPNAYHDNRNHSNSMPYAFPQQEMGIPLSIPDNSRPSIPHHSRTYPPGQGSHHHSHSYSQSYPGEPASYGHNSFEREMPSGQPLPDPGEFLRIKLGLKPGDPISLWALKDPAPDVRPPHSYPLLVRLAIYGSPNQRLTLKQIYEAIEERFEWYRKRPKGAWKGSIRHNLSLNQVFKNIHRPLTEPGKGNYWEIDHSKGEGYKRDRKRKSRKAKEEDKSRLIDDEFEEDEYISGCDDAGMVESELSDSSQRPSSSSSHRASSSRAARRASPYSSPSDLPPRRIDSASSPRPRNSGDLSHYGYDSGGSASSGFTHMSGYGEGSPPPNQIRMDGARQSGGPDFYFFPQDIASSPESSGYVSPGSSTGYGNEDGRRHGTR